VGPRGTFAAAGGTIFGGGGRLRRSMSIARAETIGTAAEERRDHPRPRKPQPENPSRSSRDEQGGRRARPQGRPRDLPVPKGGGQRTGAGGPGHDRAGVGPPPPRSCVPHPGQGGTGASDHAWDGKAAPRRRFRGNDRRAKGGGRRRFRRRRANGVSMFGSFDRVRVVLFERGVARAARRARHRPKLDHLTTLGAMTTGFAISVNDGPGRVCLRWCCRVHPALENVERREASSRAPGGHRLRPGSGPRRGGRSRARAHPAC